MEHQEPLTEKTWDDVARDMREQSGEPHGSETDRPPHGHGAHGPHNGPGPHGGPEPHRHGGGRITTYLLLVVLLNVLLAVYALYVVGPMLEAGVITTGNESLPALIFRALLFASPILLTVLINRLLYRLVRGRGRFPLSVGITACVLAVLVQVLTVYIIFTAGGAAQFTSFDVETITSAVTD